jgi:hypothetical protein
MANATKMPQEDVEKLETVMIRGLLINMGYRGPERCCGTCRHYRECDMSGSHNAKGEHCTLNPAADIPVQAAGDCRFWNGKPQDNEAG